MKGGRDPLTKLFMLTITGNKMTEKEIQLSPILEYFIANSIYECSSKQNLEIFYTKHLLAQRSQHGSEP